MKEKEMGFRLVYTTLKSSKKNLTNALLDTEKRVREKVRFYQKETSLEVVSVARIGFRSYLVIWKATGETIREIRKGTNKPKRPVTLKYKAVDSKGIDITKKPNLRVEVHFDGH